MINTVTGPISPDALGATYMHEHLIIDSPIVATQMPHISLPYVHEAVAELKLCYASGVRSMVDCMPGETGRNLKKLREISLQTGINVIAATGMHNPKYYPIDHPYLKLSSEALSEIFIDEITVGSENSEIKCGIIKIFTLGESLSALEKRVFEAAANTQKVTGVPILTHCEEGKGALEQIEYLRDLGVNLSRVVLSHTDKVQDISYHRELWSSGVNLEYDQVLRQYDHANPSSINLIINMIEDGHIEQLMLGTDGARRSLWKSLGGFPGLNFLFSDWFKKRQITGLTEDLIIQIFLTNSTRFLNLNFEQNR